MMERKKIGKVRVVSVRGAYAPQGLERFRNVSRFQATFAASVKRRRYNDKVRLDYTVQIDVSSYYDHFQLEERRAFSVLFTLLEWLRIEVLPVSYFEKAHIITSYHGIKRLERATYAFD